MNINQAIKAIRTELKTATPVDAIRAALSDVSGLPPETNTWDEATVTDAIAKLKESATEPSAPTIEAGDEQKQLTATTDGSEIAAAPQNPLGETANALNIVRSNVAATMTMSGAADADEASVAYLSSFNERLATNAGRIEIAMQAVLNNGLGDKLAGTVGKEIQTRREQASNSLDQFFL